MGPAARLVARRPVWAIGIVLAVTAMLAVFAAQRQTDTDLTAFAPESELGRAYTSMEKDLSGASGAVQVILDAGDGGSVIGSDGIAAVLAVRQALEADPSVLGALAPAAARRPPIMSFAHPVIGDLIEQGIDPARATDEEIETAALRVYRTEEAALAAALVSRDGDLTVPEARAGMVLVRFRPGLTDLETSEVALRVKEIVAGVGIPGLTVEVFSLDVLFDELQQSMNRELPPLLGLSFLLVVAILAIFYRTASDVALGMIGLVLAILWMYGVGVLLGPDYLGWLGVFSQIAIAVPVLLVGLGIDYSVHLTSRYREERSLGTGPPEAARMAVLTVGGALVLATLVTIIGFLTNLASPVPPVGDFGVFCAVGVLAAFVVMVFLVPSARNLLDRRGAGAARPTREPLRLLTRVMRATTVLATRVPLLTLAFALAVTGVSIGVASGLTTEFSQEDFIPEGSEAERLVGVVDSLFGGDVSEETGLLVTGDFRDPGLANAMLEVEANLIGVPGVRLAGDRAQASSPASVMLLARQVATEFDPAHAADFTALGMLETGFATDADMLGLLLLAAEYVPAELGPVIARDGSVAAIRVFTSAGDGGAADLAAGLDAAAAPLIEAGAEVVVTSRNLMIAEVSVTLTAAQQRSIAVTLGAALLLLVLYFWVTERRPMLGVVTMAPSLLVVAWTLGTMRLMGLSFNVLTGTIASIAIGIGVPYAIHITHRFMEDRRRTADVTAAIRMTVGHTGAALAGSALTTAAGFGVLYFSSIVPMQQFGAMTAVTILYSLAAAVLAQPAFLVLWDRFGANRASRRPASTAA